MRICEFNCSFSSNKVTKTIGTCRSCPRPGNTCSSCTRTKALQANLTPANQLQESLVMAMIGGSLLEGAYKRYRKSYDNAFLVLIISQPLHIRMLPQMLSSVFELK